VPNSHRSKLLRIYISESDRHDGKPLYEAIAAKCRELEIAGATVFRGLEGYGEAGEIHGPHLLQHAQPIVITVVDSAAKLSELVPVLEEMIETGMMAVSDVRTVRVQKNGASATGHSEEHAG